MMDTAICAGCGGIASYEKGWTREMGGRTPGIYCHICRPPGQGYTLADLEAARAEIQMHREAAKLDRELRIVEAGGMEVLDFMQGREIGRA